MKGATRVPVSWKATAHETLSQPPHIGMRRGKVKKDQLTTKCRTSMMMEMSKKQRSGDDDAMTSKT
jgi:hypothetical protein